MKKALLLVLIALSIAAIVILVDTKSQTETTNPQSTSTQATHQSTTIDEIMVFICTSPNAYAFHIDSTCKYLNKCGSEIEKITVEEAQKMSRKPCKACSVK